MIAKVASAARRLLTAAKKRTAEGSATKSRHGQSSSKSKSTKENSTKTGIEGLISTGVLPKGVSISVTNTSPRMQWDLRQAKGPIVTIAGNEAILDYGPGEWQTRLLKRTEKGGWIPIGTNQTENILASLHHQPEVDKTLEYLYTKYINTVMLADLG